MKFSDIVMACAVLLAPFFAVFAQRQIDVWRERRNRKLGVFRTLMATRGAKLSPDHVQALNMIDVEFIGRRHSRVREIWKEYLDHLGLLSSLQPEDQQRALPSWTAKGDDFLADLLAEMGRTCGYKFDKVTLKRGIYSPQGHANIELENQAMRRLLLEVLAGRRVLPTSTSIVPLNAEAAEEGKKLLEALRDVLEGKRALKYQLKKEDGTNKSPEATPSTHPSTTPSPSAGAPQL